MIFQKIIINSIIWSFLINIFTGLLIFNGKTKIFSILSKIILSLLTIIISSLLIKQGFETETCLINLIYFGDLVYELIEISNPVINDIDMEVINQTMQETIRQLINNKELIENSSTSFNILTENDLFEYGTYSLYFNIIIRALHYISPSIFNNIKLIPEKFFDGFNRNDNEYLIIKFLLGIGNSMTALTLENYVALITVSLGFLFFCYVKKKISAELEYYLDIELKDNIEE